jgi:hypothetical protein
MAQIAILLTRSTCVGVGEYGNAGETVHVDAQAAAALTATDAGRPATDKDQAALDDALDVLRRTPPSRDAGRIGKAF